MPDPAPTCSTCEYWDRRYPQNPQLGACKRLGVLDWGKDVAIIVSAAYDKPTSDFEAVRTREHFGCCFHSAFNNPFALT